MPAGIWQLAGGFGVGAVRRIASNVGDVGGRQSVKLGVGDWLAGRCAAVAAVVAADLSSGQHLSHAGVLQRSCPAYMQTAGEVRPMKETKYPAATYWVAAVPPQRTGGPMPV